MEVWKHAARLGARAAELDADHVIRYDDRALMHDFCRACHESIEKVEKR
jgi:hypothetical protein